MVKPIVLINDQRKLIRIIGILLFLTSIVAGLALYKVFIYQSELSEIKLTSTERLIIAQKNRAEYLARQHKADSIIAYETLQRALTKKIQEIQIEDLKRKGLWKE